MKVSSKQMGRFGTHSRTTLPLTRSSKQSGSKHSRDPSKVHQAHLDGLLLEDIDKINGYLSSLSPQESEACAKMAIESGFIQFEEEEEGE